MESSYVADRFKHFGEIEAKDSSDLYSQLALLIAGDSDILSVAAKAPRTQPLPNLLFASVQLLLEEEGASIKAGEPIESAFSRLQMVVLDRRTEIEDLLSRKLVQTNEVRRSIYLFSAFARACSIFPDRPIALVELGSSAGFNLLFDRYGYQYSGRPPFGKSGAGVTVRAELRGEKNPPTEMCANIVATRVGLDLNPIDVFDEADIRWLRALIWPEHEERRLLFDRVLAERRNAQVEMIAGDGVQLLPSILDRVGKEAVPFVFHTHVANQLSTDSKCELLAAIDRQGSHRDIVHAHNNIEPHLHMTVFDRGQRSDLPLAHVDGHARWVEWLDVGS